MERDDNNRLEGSRGFSRRQKYASSVLIYLFGKTLSPSGSESMPQLFRPLSELASCLVLAASVLLSGCDSAAPTRDAAVVTTGNAGRIVGSVISQGNGSKSDVEALLFRKTSAGDSLQERTRTDSSGGFAFPDASIGRYRIEAWCDGRLCGKSGEFEVKDTTPVNIIIVLVQPTQLLLDLRSQGNFDSVFFGNPTNPGIKTDLFWIVNTTTDSSAILYTRLPATSGTRTWLTWKLDAASGTWNLLGSEPDSVIAWIRTPDSSAYRSTAHTLALWTFDELDTQGAIPDEGPLGASLSLPSSPTLVPSPSGKALSIGSANSVSMGRFPASSLSSSLSWWKTGMRTIRLKLKVDSIGPDEVRIAGDSLSFQITINSSRQILLSYALRETLPGRFGEQRSSQVISGPGSFPVGRWFELVVSSSSSAPYASAWVEGRPIELFPLCEGLDPSTPARIAKDLFQVAVHLAPNSASRIFIDEIRLSDTLDFGSGRAWSPSHILPLGSSNDSSELVVFGFADSSAQGSGPDLDSSYQQEVSDFRGLFFSSANPTRVPQTAFAVRIGLFPDGPGISPSIRLALYPAKEQFLARARSSMSLRPGTDYDTIPVAISMPRASVGDPVLFSPSSTLLGAVRSDRSGNFGMVLKPYGTISDPIKLLNMTGDLASPSVEVYSE